MSEKRRVLGRGLGALIPTSFGESERRPPDVVVPGYGHDTSSALNGVGGSAAHFRSMTQATSEHGVSFDEDSTPGHAELRTIPGVSFGLIPVDAITPNSRQPRVSFDEDDLAELAHSITLVGVLQPVVVRGVVAPADDRRYELVVGERRWRAARLAGLTHLPAIVKGIANDDMLRDALLENLHRTQLNPLEEAAAYEQLLSEFSLKHDELADRVGKSRSHVTNTIRLMKLPATVARRVAAGVLSAGHARALLGLDDPIAMERLAQRIVAEGLSVRAVEELIAVGAHRETPGSRGSRVVERSPELTELATRLGDALETRVQISIGQRKGRLTVDFSGVDDLGRILEALGLSTYVPEAAGLRGPQTETPALTG